MAKIIITTKQYYHYDITEDGVNTQYYYDDGTISDTFTNDISQLWKWKISEGLVVFQPVSPADPGRWYIDSNIAQQAYQQYLLGLITGE